MDFIINMKSKKPKVCNKNPRAIIDAKQSSAKITKCQFCTEKNKSASLPTRPIPPAIKPSCMAAKAGAQLFG